MNHAPLIHSKRALLLMGLAAGCPFVQAGTVGYLSTSTAAGTSKVGPTAVYAGSTAAAPQDSINARETARRQAKTAEAMQLLQEGRTAYSEKKYKDALDKYQAAWNTIPKAPATQKMQEFIVKSIGDASVAVAIEYSRVGRYDDAEQLLLDVLSRDPNNQRARKELSLLRDPVRNNPALTPEHVKNVEEVNRLLTLAYGYLDLGNYDAAYAEFNRVIAIDPYNTAARRGQEQVSKRRANYYTAAYDSFRAKALAEVDALWEEQQPQDLPDAQLGGGETTQNFSEGVLRNSENLNSLHISSVNFEETPMEDALDFLRAEARKAGLSINFIYQKAQSNAPAPAPAPVATNDDDEEEGDDEEEEEDSAPAAAPAPVVKEIQPAVIDRLSLKDVTAADLLKLMCEKAGCEMRVEDKAVVVYQKGAASQRMSRRQWAVRPSFFSSGSGDDEESDDEDSDFTSSSKPRSRKIDAKASLIDMGVQFLQGASAQYSRTTGVLTVVNTDDELDAVEEAINKFRQDMPKMVKVSTKFVEISQQNDEELSFDWVINPFSINDAGTAFLGGVNGANASTKRAFQDFVTNGGSGWTNNAPKSGSWPISQTGAATDTITNGLMTGGLRSGSGAISSSAISNLIASGSASAAATSNVAPGVLSLSGIYDSGSYQMIMRGLSQKKGVDVMSAPSLVVSGDDQMEYAPAPDPLASDQNDEQGCAKIEVIRRFIYPIAYDAPQIPNSTGTNNNNNDNNSSSSYPIAAPSNPSEWAVEEVGIMMRFQIESLKDSDSDIVRFKRFEIRVVDFEGFVNYGSPIVAAVANQSQIQQVMLTENRIDMPVFSRRYVNSNPCVYDGHTIAIGGLIEDEVQKVEDKVPVFGDLPLVGRLFRSEAESHVRKNLMIFVTAEVIDPFGKPLRKRDTGRGGEASTAGTSTPGLFPDDGLVNP